MIKLFGMIKRRSDMTFEEFQKYYLETHAPLALRLMPPALKAGMVFYRHNYILKVGETEPPYDVMMETIYFDADCWQKCYEWYLSDAGKPLRDDEKNFIGKFKIIMTGDERVLLDNSK